MAAPVTLLHWEVPLLATDDGRPPNSFAGFLTFHLQNLYLSAVVIYTSFWSQLKWLFWKIPTFSLLTLCITLILQFYSHLAFVYLASSSWLFFPLWAVAGTFYLSWPSHPILSLHICMYYSICRLYRLQKPFEMENTYTTPRSRIHIIPYLLNFSDPKNDSNVLF